MTAAKRVAVRPKPEQVAALRSTWRTTTQHRIAQAWRFLRLYVFTFAGQVLVQVVTTALAGGVDVTQLDRKALVALVIPAAEVVWRQKHPALTAAEADSAPGVTIVPDEVGGPPDD